MSKIFSPFFPKQLSTSFLNRCREKNTCFRNYHKKLWLPIKKSKLIKHECNEDVKYLSMTTSHVMQKKDYQYHFHIIKNKSQLTSANFLGYFPLSTILSVSSVSDLWLAPRPEVSVNSNTFLYIIWYSSFMAFLSGLFFINFSLVSSNQS